MATTTYVGSVRTGNEAGSVVLLSTELNSLANAQGALSGEIANDTERDLFVDLQLSVDFAVAPNLDSEIEVYFVRCLDGATFEDATAGASPRGPKNGYVGSFYLNAITSPDQRLIIPMVQLPPRDFKVLAINKSGQAFPASGSTIKGYFYNYKSQ